MIKLHGGRVLIKQEETKKKGGLVSVSDDKERPEYGKVVSIGDSCVRVKKNDIVVFNKYAPDEITVDGESFLIISEGNIVGTIHGK